MKKYLFFILLLISFNCFAQISVSCSALNLGSFLLDRGINSAEDNGPARLGFSNFIGTESTCTVNASANTTVLVEINNDSSSSSLINGNESIPINLRIEDSQETNLGSSHLLALPLNQTSEQFFIDASVPASSASVGTGNFSTTINVTVSYN